jgi:hypothetical protein
MRVRIYLPATVTEAAAQPAPLSDLERGKRLDAEIERYVVYYASKRDSTVYLTVDELGVIQRQAFGDVPNFEATFTAHGEPRPRAIMSGNDRRLCPACGYANSPSRQSCKRCRTPLLT